MPRGFVSPKIQVADFVTDFGASSDASDNASCLTAFQAWAAVESAAGRKVVLHVPGGYYLFNHKNCQGFLQNIKNLHMIGYGATFQNTYLLSEGQNFAFETAWGRAAYADQLEKSVAQGGGGSLINTTAIGNTSVTCTTAANAGNFVVGEWVIICSVDIQSFGAPANLDRFEFTKVTTVDAGTGVVGVSPAIRHIHSSAFVDGHTYAAPFGKARICSLKKVDGTATWDVNHIYEGLEIINAPTIDSKYMTVTGRSITFINCILPGISPSIASRVTFKDCHMKDANEPDKLVEHMSFDQCTFDLDFPLTSSSLDQVSFRDCVFRGTTTLGTAKYIHAENCRFDGQLLLGGQYGLNRKTRFVNCRATNVSPASFMTAFGGSTLAIDGGTNVLYSNGQFRVLKAYSQQHNWLVVPGQQICLTGTGGMFPGDMGVGWVTSVTDDATYRYITTTLPHTSLPSWTNNAALIRRTGELHIVNCSGHEVFRNGSDAEAAGLPPYQYKRLLFAGTTSTSGNWANLYYGILRRARVNVLKVSPSANTKLNLYNNTARLTTDLTDPLQLRVRIDVNTLGVRDWSIAGVVKLGTDDLQVNSVSQGSWVTTRILGGTWQWSYENLTPGSWSDYQLPVVEVELEFDTGMWGKSIPIYQDPSGGTIFATVGGP
jgi:hypothetical protein